MISRWRCARSRGCGAGTSTCTARCFPSSGGQYWRRGRISCRSWVRHLWRTRKAQDSAPWEWAHRVPCAEYAVRDTANELTISAWPRMLPPRKGGVSELYAVPGIGKSPFRPPFVPGAYPSSPAPMRRPRRAVRRPGASKYLLVPCSSPFVPGAYASSPFVPIRPHSSPFVPIRPLVIGGFGRWTGRYSRRRGRLGAWLGQVARSEGRGGLRRLPLASAMLGLVSSWPPRASRRPATCLGPAGSPPAAPPPCPSLPLGLPPLPMASASHSVVPVQADDLDEALAP
jgi:hypothetical protein